MGWSLCCQPCVHSDGEDERRRGVSYSILSTTPSSSKTPSSLQEAFQLAAQLRSRIAAGRRNERRTARPHPNLSFQRKLSSVKSFRESTDEDGLRDLSFKSLTEAIDSLDDISHRALAAVRELELKDDIAGEPKLSSLVNDYFKNITDLLRFFIALCNHLRTARESKTELDNSVIEELLSVSDKLSRIHDELVANKKKLDKKLRSARKWRDVCFAIHKVLCGVGILSSAALGLLLGGPVGAIIAATVATTACLSIGSWLKSRWDKYKLGLEEQRDAVAKMRRKALSSELMLRKVQSLVKRVDVAAESLHHATRDLKEKTAAAAAAADEEEMENKIGEFMKSIDSVEKEVEQCSVKLRRAMAGVTVMVTKK